MIVFYNAKGEIIDVATLELHQEYNFKIAEIIAK